MPRKFQLKAILLRTPQNRIHDYLSITKKIKYYLPSETKSIKSAAKEAAVVDVSENMSQGKLQAMLMPRSRNWKAESNVDVL